MKIWVPKFKIIEPQRELVMRTRMTGRFKLRAVAGNGSTVRRESPWFDNLLLDNGLDRIGSSHETHNRCVVGTGNTTPAVSDTALASIVASTLDKTAFVNATAAAEPYLTSKAWTYRFGQGVAEGNLAEVGVGWADANLFSRALIEDSEGDPTIFPVGSDEFLDVVYQLICHVPTVDVVDTLNISGTNHDILMRASQATTAAAWKLNSSSADRSFSFIGGGYTTPADHLTYPGAIGAITGIPSGTQNGTDSSTSNASYTSTSHLRDYTVTYGLDSSNIAIMCATTRMAGRSTGSNDALMRFQCQFTPVIDKDDTKVLTLTYRHQWSRAA